MVRRSNTLIWVAIFPLLVAPLGAAKPRADEIVERCWQALGGRDRWQAVETLELSGTQTTFSRDKPFLQLRRRPNLYRFKHFESSHEFIIGYDGEMAWWKRTLTIATKGPWPVVTPLPWAQWIAADAEFDPPFLSYRERGHALVYHGEADFEGTPAHRLEVKLTNGHVQNWYIDRETFLPIARIDHVFYVQLPQERETYYADYREVGGVMIPHYVEQAYGNEHRVREVEDVKINPEIDSGAFSLPPPAGMTKIGMLAGRFDVVAESFSFDAEVATRGLLKKTRATSTIRADFHRALLEEEISLVASDLPLRVKRLFTYDRFRRVYRIGHFDNSTAYLDILEGTFEDGRLVVSDVPTGTSWDTYRAVNNTRLVYYDLQESGFKLNLEISRDGGQTWVLDRRLTYTRATEP